MSLPELNQVRQKKGSFVHYMKIIFNATWTMCIYSPLPCPSLGANRPFFLRFLVSTCLGTIGDLLGEFSLFSPLPPTFLFGPVLFGSTTGTHLNILSDVSLIETHFFSLKWNKQTTIGFYKRMTWGGGLPTFLFGEHSFIGINNRDPLKYSQWCVIDGDTGKRNLLVLSRGHTNYDIQFIVVILKVTTRFFQQRPWITGKIIMIVLGSNMPNTNYEVYCGSASAELTQ